MASIIDRIKQSAKKRIIYTLHALHEMNAIGEMLTTDEVRHVIFSGEIIEDYPEDKRGHSCLMLECLRKEGRYMLYVRLRAIILL